MDGPERDMGGADVSYSRNYPPATRQQGRGDYRTLMSPGDMVPT